MSNVLGEAIPSTLAYKSPMLEEAEAEVKRLSGDFEGALIRYKWAREGDMKVNGEISPELIAHRARVLGDVAGELAQATYHLSRAAYEKATK